MYSTDNGPHYNAWPDGGITPFRSEKNTNWEGAWRVPAFARWPNKFPAGLVLNGIVSHQDSLPTLLAASGEPNIKEKLLQGYTAGSKKFKVHIDGINMLPYFMGQEKESPRKSFFYIDDDGQLVDLGIMIGSWFLWSNELKLWRCGLSLFVSVADPKIFNLRRDPFERAVRTKYVLWNGLLSMRFLLFRSSLCCGNDSGFKEFPPRQKPAAFNWIA
jgi:arylsulfatase